MTVFMALSSVELTSAISSTVPMRLSVRPLAAQYAAALSSPTIPQPEPVCMIELPPCSIIDGKTHFDIKKAYRAVNDLT